MCTLEGLQCQQVPVNPTDERELGHIHLEAGDKIRMEMSNSGNTCKVFHKANHG
jgi:hypothetical protein